LAAAALLIAAAASTLGFDMSVVDAARRFAAA